MLSTSILILLTLAAPLLAAPALVPIDPDLVSEGFTDTTGVVRTIYTNPRIHFSPSSSPSPSHSSVETIEKRFQFFASDQDRDTCSASSFTSKTTSTSPLASDCACLRDFLRGKKGTYSVNRDDPRFDRLATCGSCTFGVDTANFFGTVVGNTDAADVVGSVIDMFQVDGKVAAEGRMGCDNAFQTAGTDWSVFSA